MYRICKESRCVLNTSRLPINIHFELTWLTLDTDATCRLRSETASTNSTTRGGRIADRSMSARFRVNSVHFQAGQLFLSHCSTTSSLGRYPLHAGQCDSQRIFAAFPRVISRINCGRGTRDARAETGAAATMHHERR